MLIGAAKQLAMPDYTPTAGSKAGSDLRVGMVGSNIGGTNYIDGLVAHTSHADRQRSAGHFWTHVSIGIGRIVIFSSVSGALPS